MAKIASARRKKKRTHVPAEGAAAKHPSTDAGGVDEPKVPKSLIIRRGKTAQEVTDLVQDLRNMMMPYTAINFQEDAKNRKLTLQLYSKYVALPMGISHMMVFSQNENRLNLRMGRTPEGPTLHFRVHKFSLSKHIKALQKRPIANTPGLLANPPVVVTNNFGDTSQLSNNSNVEPHVKLMRITFQNLFPAINVATVKLNECRRVVLFNLIPCEANKEKAEGGDKEEEGKSNTEQPTNQLMVEMRHYAIQATAVGVHRRVRKLVASSKHKIPNLHNVQDIADYVTGQTATGGSASVASDAAPSDSEAEDDPRHTVELPDSYMGNRKAQKSALKLVELGPRLTLSLVKVEKGLGQGDILYHALVKKSPEEAAALKAKKEKEVSLKEERKAIQEANVERKRKVEEEKREVKRKRKEEKKQATIKKLREGNEVATGLTTKDSEESADEESESDDGEDSKSEEE